MLAGLERPDAVRLEGLAPFGAPAFVFVSKDGRATLLFRATIACFATRRPQQIVEALMGVAMAPPALAAALTGCGVPRSEAGRIGRRFGEDQAAIDLASGATVHLRRQRARWGIVAAVASSPRAYTVEYPDWQAERPDAFASGPAMVRPSIADLSVTLSQVDINTELDPAAFEVDVPADAAPITLDELRDAGPLGQKP